MTIRVAALAAALLAFAPAIHAAGPFGASRATTTTAAPASQPAAAPVSVTPATPVAVAVNTLNEGFDSVGNLASSGWVMLNNSATIGTQVSWGQGDTAVFNAQAGATNAYAYANFRMTNNTNTISAWLLTPELEFGRDATLTFYTRKATPAPDDYPDRLQVRYSTAGASTNVGANFNQVGDFTAMPLEINASQVVGGYPTVWTQYTITGLPRNGSGRIALRYYVINGGPTGSSSDYIGVDTVMYTTGAPEFKVGGNVSGLAGSGLSLRLNGTQNLAINANGSFEFPDYVTVGSNYTVTVQSQPTALNQTCTLTNASGQVSGTVSNVQVNCVTSQYTVSGTASGVSGNGLTLLLNGGAALPVDGNGAFAFPAPLNDGTVYSVTVGTQPSGPNQNCTVSGGSGTIAGGNVSGVQVSCTTLTYFIGGGVTGLEGSGLVLHLSNGQDLPVNANGNFLFANPIDDGSSYTVSVGTPPTAPVQNCAVSNGSGTVAGADVSNVQVSCARLRHPVGGAVFGLDGNGLVLQLNGADNLVVPVNGPFTFSQTIAEGSSYGVTVFTQPSGGLSQACRVANGAGTMGTAAVTDVVVICDYLFLNGFETP